MPKKTAILFLTIFLTGMFLPLLAQAVAGTYVACPEEFPFYNKDGGEGTWCCKEIDGKEYVDCGANRVNVCYEGFVPCGLGKPCWKDSVEQSGECVPKDDASLLKVYDEKGREIGVGMACRFCHFFVLIDGIVDFLLFKIAPFLAIAMIVVGGMMFYFGGSKPDLLTRGRKLIIGVVIGLFLIYGAFMLTGVFLSALGVTEWTGLGEWAQGGPFRISCDM